MPILQLNIGRDTGCIILIWLILILSPECFGQLVSSFEIKPHKNCVPVTVGFQNTSVNQEGAGYSWNLGKGTRFVSEEQIVYETYTDTGLYIVTLFVNNGIDTATSVKTLHIGNGPTADVEIDHTTGCAPYLASIRDASNAGSNEIVSWEWDLRNGTVLPGPEIQFEYTDTGKYDVFLKVTDNSGCTNFIEKKNFIQVVAPPHVTFTVDKSFACDPPLKVTFTNNTTYAFPLEYHWDFGNGDTSDLISPTAIFTKPGSYDVTLIASAMDISCEVDQVSQDLIILNSGEVDFFAVQYTDTIIDDLDTLCPGEIKFRSRYGAGSQNSWQINGKTTGFGDILETHFADSGIIQVQLTTGYNSACPESITKTFYIDHVKADFNLDKTYFCNLPVNVKLTSLAQNASKVRWNWPGLETEISDSLTTAVIDTLEQKSTELALVTDTVPISLEVTNTRGCVSTKTREIKVVLPVANLKASAYSGCVPLEVDFSDESLTSESIFSWQWIINEEMLPGTNENEKPYTFIKPGTYDVSLVITTDSSCMDTSEVVKIRTGRKSTISLDVSGRVCNDGMLSVSATSDVQDSVDQWVFYSPNFFNTGVIAKPTSTIKVNYDYPGFYDVYATMDYNGCITDSVFFQEVYAAGPTGKLRSEFDCESPYSYTFFQRHEQATSWIWKVDGQEFEDQDTLAYIFSTTGDYNVEIVFDNDTTGCQTKHSSNIKVRDPKAHISASPFNCLGEPFEVDSELSLDYITECDFEGFLWDFGDGAPPRRTYETTFSHFFSQKGEYKVQLVAVDDNLCTDTAFASVLVSQPEVDFNADPDKGCYPAFRVNFEDVSDDNTIVSNTWDFGDNSLRRRDHDRISHDYFFHANDTYYPSLEVTDIYGCKNTLQKQILAIIPNVAVTANARAICVGEQVHFTSSRENDSVTWNLGNGFSFESSPVQTYDDKGFYDIVITAYKQGCTLTDTLHDFIRVERPDATFQVNDSVFDCYPVTLTMNRPLNGNTFANGSLYLINNHLGLPYASTVSYIFDKPGTYEVKLNLISSLGCFDSKEKTVEVNGPSALFHIPQNIACTNDTVNFEITQSENVNSVLWTFGDGSMSALQHPQHVYRTPGTYKPVLTIYDAGECAVSVQSDSVQISDIEAKFAMYPVREVYCEDEEIRFSRVNAPTVIAHWLIPGLIDEISTLLYQRFESGEYEVIYIAKNQYNCVDTATTTFRVIKNPEISVMDDVLVCPGDEVLLEAETKNADLVIWQPSAFLDDSLALAPLSKALETTMFYATAFNEQECMAKDSVQVTMANENVITRRPVGDTLIEIGETITLNINATRDVEVSWRRDAGISCTNCLDPEVRPLKNTVYKVNLKDICFDMDLEFLVEVFQDHKLLLPDAFTPNGDGENDVIYLQTKKIKEITEFSIFNRWGNRVFSTNNINQGWDGTYMGQYQPADVYTYFIRGFTIHDYEVFEKGTIILIR